MKGFYFFVCFCFCLAVNAQNSIEIDINRKVYVEEELLFFPDSLIGGDLNVAIKKFQEGQFFSYKTHTESFTGKQYFFWAGVNLKSSQKSTNSFIVDFPTWEYINIYLFCKDSLISQHVAGVHIPVNKREIKLGLQNAVEITLERNVEYTLLFKVSDRSINNNNGILGFSIVDRNTFFDKLNKERFFNGMFMGIILIMILYNLFIFISVRDKSYIFYVLTILGNGLIWFTNYKLHYEYFFPNASLANIPEIGLMISSFFGICFTLFTQSFLETKIRNRIWHYMGNVIIILLILVPVAFYINSDWYRFLYQFSFLLGLILFVSILVVSGISFFRKFRPARFFFLANIFYACGFVIVILGVFGLYSDDSYLINSMQIGNILEIALFSLALADRINILKSENEKKQVDLIEQLKENERLKSQVALELEAKVKERTVEINQQNEEISAQRDLLQEQNDKLNIFHNHTTESLRYAQSIQAAILPSEKVLQQISPECFVLKEPCELVSGDFIWATTIGDNQVFCVADCTGHGVPGAFMSILGITALNEIVNKHFISNPAQILGFLRESVIEALSQNDPQHLHKDGMDIALCSFNTITRELQFAGAGIPLWLVSKDIVSENSSLKLESSKTMEHNGFKLFEVKGDVMPVGQSPLTRPFTNNVFRLSGSNASIYMSTDGFADQFGGENLTKFGTQELKRAILHNFEKEMIHQQEILRNSFSRWKGENYQVDDVTIMGLRI